MQMAMDLTAPEQQPAPQRLLAPLEQPAVSS